MRKLNVRLAPRLMLNWVRLGVAVCVLLAFPSGSVQAASVELPAATVLARYAEAIAAVQAPKVVAFDYTLEQSGARDLQQEHRVFRSGLRERDEILSVDGKKLEPPIVRIFSGKRDRYSIVTLAPRPAQYTFTYVGPKRVGHHVDYVFDLDAKVASAFAVTRVTIDGVKFLPTSIVFATGSHAGHGEIAFAQSEKWWVPVLATAHATVANQGASERIAFSAYRFPLALPSSTFNVPRPLPTFTPISL
jgi:hypothetical protein